MEEGGEGSEIKSYDPVSKKPKLVSHQDPSAINDLECMKEDESDNDCSDELDISSHIPLDYFLLEKSIEEKTRDDAELGKIRKKIAELRLMGFKGICFYPCRISIAYSKLSIFSDPRGFKISYSYSYVLEHNMLWRMQRGYKVYYRDEFIELSFDCRDPKQDMEYLKLLVKLKDSGVDAKKGKNESLEQQCYELMEACGLDVYDYEHCISDYFIIYEYVERVNQWRSLQKILLDDNSKGKYSKDPQRFKETLKEDYPLIYQVVLPNDCGRFIDNVVETAFEAVVKWWRSASDKDEENAKMFIEDRCKKAIEDHDDRLKETWTKADYIKLKFDVARISGFAQVPDEIADFRLPGHYIWNASKSTFDPLPFEAL